ncbi:hypothetical protein S83_005961 [Arachis hypogaea]
MELPKQLFFFFLTLIFLSGHIGLQAEARVRHYGPTKLFVFGDSYVDAGNTRKDQPGSWKQPYGITFPVNPPEDSPTAEFSPITLPSIWG